MDFIHVHDIARSVVAGAGGRAGNLPINIGTGIDTSVADLARILIEAVGVDVEPQFNPRDVLVSRRAADTDPGPRGARLRAAIPVDEGMTDLVRGTRPGTDGPDPVAGRHVVTGVPVRPTAPVVLDGDRGRVEPPARD